MTNLVLSMWEQKRGNHSSIESSPIIVLDSFVGEIFPNLTCACEIFKVTNAIFCKRLEYTLELRANLRAWEARGSFVPSRVRRSTERGGRGEQRE